MTESSTDEAVTPQETKEEQRTVPVAAVAKERAEKRAARDEVDRLKQELDEARKKLSEKDEVLLSAADEIAAEARKAVEAELKPWKEKTAKYELAMQLGLNESQADKVMDIRTKNPGLSEQQALLLARSEHQDLFPAGSHGQSFTRVHGGLPVSSNPAIRSVNDQPNFVEKMNEAAKNGDRGTAQHYATQEAIARFRRAFEARK